MERATQTIEIHGVRDEVLQFEGEELSNYVDNHGELNSSDDRGTDYTLYRLADGTYRVLRYYWSRWQGEESVKDLLPNNVEQHQYLDPDDPEYGFPVKYGSYTEEQARRLYPRLFLEAGIPNVRNLDDE